MNKAENDAFRLQSIIDGTHLGTWEWNVQTGDVIFNDIWAEIIGYTLAELAPISIKTWETLCHPDDLKISRELLERHFSGEQPYYDIECRIKHKDGHWAWVHDRGKVFSWTTDGKALMMFGTHTDITVRKNAEDELFKAKQKAEENEEKYKQIFNNTRDVIFMIEVTEDLRYKMLDTNAAHQQIFSNLGNIQNKFLDEFIPAEIAAALKNTYDQCVKNQEVIKYEESFQWDDKMYHSLTQLIPVKNSSGRVYRIIGICNNITDLKELTNQLISQNSQLSLLNTDISAAKEKAEENEKRISLLFEHMPLNFTLHEIMLDESGKACDFRWIDINPSSEISMGKKALQVVGKTNSELFPGTPQSWIDRYSQVALTGIPDRYESFSTHLNKYFDMRSYSPKAGQIATLGIDITDSKLAEKAIWEEKERLAVTLRSIGDGVITTDTSGTVVSMNKVAEELCGWNQGEAQGKPLTSVFNVVNESTRMPHDNPVEKVLSTGQIIELANHTLLISRDGSERIIADSGAPIKDNENKTIGVVLVFRDMTEKQKLLETAQNVQKLESLGVLAGGIAHDFNNLMCGIYGYIDLAFEQTDRSRVSGYLSKAMNTIDRARGLTSQLLTFAKGGAPIQKVEHLFPFVQETAAFALSGANVSCDFDVPQDLWAGNFDKNQIGQVFDNLIINAQQAMPLGGTIELTARNITFANEEHPVLSPGNYVKMSVIDHGIGIQKELLCRIFDPFFTTKPKGHGLGLATCYSIITRHDGCIDVESDVGKGSTFHVYLPACKNSVLSSVEKTATVHKGCGTFLIMDDEEVIREAIKSMLETFGYYVVCKENGVDAVGFVAEEMSAKRSVTAMIFDLTVPGGMGGRVAVEEIRKLNLEIPVFVASGYADDPVVKNPTDYGFVASICKPFRKSELVEMLNKHLKTI